MAQRNKYRTLPSTPRLFSKATCIACFIGYLLFNLRSQTVIIRRYFSTTKNCASLVHRNALATDNALQEDYINGIFRLKRDLGISPLCNLLKGLKHPLIPRDINNNTCSSINVVYEHKCNDIMIGNILSEYFINRIIAGYAGIDFSHKCRGFSVRFGAESVLNNLKDPIPLDMFPSTIDRNEWMSVCDRCIGDKDYSNHMYPHTCREMSGITSLVPLMKQEFEVLALNTFQTHPELQAEIDDVAIHVRLGDLLKIKIRRRKMGATPFQAYLDIIPRNNVSSIGIISAPVNDKSDSGIILHGLKAFLEQHYPNVRVTIRNSSSDSASVVFTRLVKAPVMTVCTTSTFCLWPTLASQAKTLVLIPSFLYGGKHPNWVDKLDGNLNGTIMVPMVKHFPSTAWPSENLGPKLLVILSTMTEEEYKVSSFEELDA